MKRFQICFNVIETKLATVISLLSNEVQDLKVSEVLKDRRNHPSGRNGSGAKAMKDTRLGKLVMEQFPGRDIEVKTAELIKAVEKEGFASTSAASTASGLVRDGLLKRVSPGTYKRA